MKTIYKLEDYTTYIVYARVLHEPGEIQAPLYNLFNIQYHHENDILIPIPENIKYERKETTVDVEIPEVVVDKNLLTDKSKLFIHPNCTIPRAKITQKYKRVIKREKADFCVVPAYPRLLNGEEVAIFKNEETSQLFVVIPHVRWCRGKPKHFAPTMCEFAKIGSSALNIIPDLIKTSVEDREIIRNGVVFNKETWTNFINSTLKFYGPSVWVNSDNKYIADIIYDEVHNILTEDDVLASITDEENIFNKDMYDSMLGMLNSDDESVIGIALKTVSELDYVKYYNTISHLLTSCAQKWRDNNMKNTVSVKHMLNFLKIRQSNSPKYLEETTQEDFDLMIETLKSEFIYEMSEYQKLFLGNYPFVNLEFSYNFNVTPRLKNE